MIYWELIILQLFTSLLCMQEFHVYIFKNGGVHFYLCVIHFHESMSRKGVAMLARGALLTTHFKLNGNLYCWLFLIVKL